MPTIPAYTVSDFIAEDSPRSLFPLDSQVLYAKHGSKAMADYIEDGIFDDQDRTRAFLNAPICYALKDARHMRKVLGLDPIATHFLYGFVHRHALTSKLLRQPTRGDLDTHSRIGNRFHHLNNTTTSGETPIAYESSTRTTPE